MRVLIVEDEIKVAGLIRNALKEGGFASGICPNGSEVYAHLTSTPYDLIVLDIMLPGLDGLAVLRQLRERKLNVPVLLLSARSEVYDRVEGLNIGADDYLAKPFSTDELLARLRALLRRSAGHGLNAYRVQDLTLNLLSRELHRGTRKIDLTSKEFALLEYFMRSPDRVFSRTQILEAVWDYHFDPGTNIVDVYVQRLRRKIDAEEPVRLIQTVRGIGYALRPEPS